MIDLNYFKEQDRSIESLISGIDSVFLDRFCESFKTLYFWIPVALILFFVIIRNNTKKSYILLSMILLIAACCYAEGFLGGKVIMTISVIFGLFVFLSLQIKSASFTLPFVLCALIYSFADVYSGLHFTYSIISIVAGTITGTVFYCIYRLFIKTTKKRSYNTGYSRRVYTSSRYLSNDINMLQCALFGTFIVILLFTVVTSLSSIN